jgi:hypothetical protein
MTCAELSAIGTHQHNDRVDFGWDAMKTSEMLNP